MIKSLPDLGGITIQDVGPLAPMAPGVHTISNEQRMATTYGIVRQVCHRFMCEIITWSDDIT